MADEKAKEEKQPKGEKPAKDEAAAAALFRRAALRGSPIAQNRLARLYSAGRGVDADPVEAIKWHLIAKAAGANDAYLDEFAQKQTPEVRANADRAAQSWINVIGLSRS